MGGKMDDDEWEKVIIKDENGGATKIGKDWAGWLTIEQGDNRVNISPETAREEVYELIESEFKER